MKIQNKTLLITGGTGSFGHAVLNRFLHTDHFKEIRIFSRDEKKQDDMRNQLKNDKLKFYIGDVRDYASVDRASHNSPLRRNVTIEEVGNAAAFMLSDLASGITGEIMYVDGGMNTTALGNADPLPA